MTREEAFIKAARMYGRITDKSDKVDEMLAKVNNGDMKMSFAVYDLRSAWERYLSTTTCSLRDLVYHVGNGDLLLKFSRHTVLNELLTTGPLKDIYERERKRRAI